MAPTTAHPPMIVAKNYEELCVQAVKNILALSKNAIKERNRFSIALSGGSTPRGVYSLMASPAYGDRFDWKKIHFFLGDERWVPGTSPRSNYKMIADIFLTGGNIPLSHFHAIRTDTPDVQSSASLYEKELIKYFALKPGEFPRFDLVLLGLGQDGHTASLFPDHTAVDERKRLVVGATANETAEKRITLTLPVLNHAHAIDFLVSGFDKAEVLKQVWEGKENRFLPVERVNPRGGQVRWFIDKAAASLLENKYEK